MMFGGRTGEEDSADIIDRAIDAGVNFLDTANVYSTGASEVAVGKALKRNGKRDAIVLATKVHGVMDEADPNASGNHRRHVIEQCEASLGRLGVDYIDLYQIHRPSSDVPIDETLRALDDLIRAGKVRYAGTSTFATWQLVEALWAAKELGLNRFVTEQPPYHFLDRRIERELVPFAQTYGTALIPWSPLAGGFLTGKYGRYESLSPKDSRYGLEPRRMGRNHFTEAAFDVLEAVQTIADERLHPGTGRPCLVQRPARRHEPHHRAAHYGATRRQPRRRRSVSRRGRPRAPRRRCGPGAGHRPLLRGGLRPAPLPLVSGV
jgi:aryl-alcohol dehydrogenase-like predicted oxidoreductase